MRCVIIEDEPLARERIMNYMARLPFLELAASFDNGYDALGYLTTAQIDLVFLDINIGELSGIRLLETGGVKSQVIIITAYDEYALKGYELSVTDYLLKPYSFERFVQAVEKARSKLATAVGALPERKFFFVKTEHRLERVMFSDLLFIEGMRDYRKIFTTGRPLMTLQTFGELEDEIPAAVACRVHKSFMVALHRIETIERDQIRIGDKSIPVSDTYKKAFYERIHHPAANIRK